MVRKIWGISENEPINDIVSLIEKSGIKVLLYPFNFQKAFSLSINKKDGGPAIIVNTDDAVTLERRIFSIAQELCHLILHSASYNGKVEEENKEEEKDSYIFACELLGVRKSF